MAKTIANVETKHGASYAKRLCRHFAHKIPATVEDRHARIEFPFGPCNIDVDDTHMHIVVELSDESQIERAESVVADHLVRMANKDEPVVTWVRVPDDE
ncbi:MAG: DUF2218 domain-containing protein [Gammaproteobacteria bacterium]|nr:DUF2218 domain-containing protein [Gammaproteobacteria bacterium]NNE59553.1 DUF2218 domain-containing protein [Woeseia sp.]